ncbi:MAG: methyltransferase domain-containing protein [Burkholderiales bacterium]|nr:methyltransferase domain-containing protein [Burkholderiales bacterium]
MDSFGRIHSFPLLRCHSGAPIESLRQRGHKRHERVSESSETDSALRRYYAARAREYEAIYGKPERQRDLRRLEKMLPELLSGRRVLEIACGTGYWTQFIAPAATTVVAVDTSPEALEIAAAKPLPPGRVRFEVGDCYALSREVGRFDGVFAGFWWSHVLIRDQARFLAGLDRLLDPGARVVLLDNRYVEGSSTPVSHRDEEGNTYQRRRLADGSEHVVLKNFPGEDDLRRAAGPRGLAFRYEALDYYWVCSWG